MTATETRGSLGYVPALDAVRGVAICLVVGYHAVDFPAAGYLGVDLFFVLSGFLITTLLLQEQGRTGRIDLPAFYRRRIVRLAPAFYAYAAVMAVIGLLMGHPPLLEAVGWASIYLADWHNGTASEVPRLVAHFWSLSVEEQFYFVWPFLVVLAMKSRSIDLLRAALVATIVAMIVARPGSEASAQALHFFPQFRAEGLLWGCLAGTFYVTHPNALRRLAHPAPMLAILGAILVITSRPLSIVTAYENGGFTALMVAMTIVVWGSATLGTQLHWLFRPLQELGKLSYSLYLWHVFVLVLLPPVLGLPASVGAAYASNRYIERRFLRFRHPRPKVRKNLPRIKDVVRV